MIEKEKDRVDRSVGNWAKILPGLPLDNLLVFSRMRLIIDGITLGRNAILKNHDLTEGEFELIAILMRNNRPMSPTELTREARVSAGGVTKRLKLLEQRKMILKIEHPTDKRAYSVQIRPFVFNIMRPVLEEISAAEEEYLADMSADDRTCLQELLRELALVVERRHPMVPHTAPIDDPEILGR